MLVCGQNRKGLIMGIGGNQSNKVSIAAFNPDRITGYFYPTSYPIPKAIPLPIINCDGVILSNPNLET
jgi:hypothetical protein